jgi:hypothetical protein
LRKKFKFIFKKKVFKTVNIIDLIGSFGTSSQLCNQYFPSLVYRGKYSFFGTNQFMFSKAMPFQCPTETSLSGVVSTVPCETKIEIQIRNSFDNVSVSKNISIVEALYENPKVDIINKQKFFYLPMKKHRSDLITLVSEVTLPNIANKANTKGWKCHTVNKETGLDIKQINFTDNPTFDYAELVIRPNVLIYAPFLKKSISDRYFLLKMCFSVLSH